MDTENVFSSREQVQVDFWDQETDENLVCVDVHSETHDVKTFTFVSLDGKLFRFRAGQYFAFDLPINREFTSRCYSISSSPLRPNAISVTVKRVPGGVVSNWMHENLSPNTVVKGFGPLGNFTKSADHNEKYLFLSAGSGITPLMSMVRELADLSATADVTFVHAARSPQDFIFRDELATLATKLKSLRLILIPEEISNERSWPGFVGRISKELLSLTVPDISQRLVMCCGPGPFMSAAREISTQMGVSESRYIEESFQDAVPLPGIEPAQEVMTETGFKVEFIKQTRTIDVASDQTVLAAAKKSGIKIPSSCSNGLCGTCKSKLITGSVSMNHNGGIRQREIDGGMFLPCCSKPLTDLVVDR
ncbi:hybrid-cluster NAD(P)-dependent oxidoreductase [Pseudomonas sp. Irchel s3b5]|uniref:hybrid-cluster NAD(P)-dependent oxidoreductase n=1 Tax=Pseudomonas sp. Irchel s3b5 TaxID=2009077 RepID=UPI000BA2DDF3|nr:hybrid-cluster NAD(P)-dependent oxidoreductase [Pseudomonas sp. Irchel s3b5]